MVTNSTTECNTDTNLRAHPELWARMALITIFCCSGSDECVQKRIEALITKKNIFGTRAHHFQILLLHSFPFCSETVDFFSTNGESYSRCVEVYTFKDMFRKYDPRCVGILSLKTVFFNL